MDEEGCDREGRQAENEEWDAKLKEHIKNKEGKEERK